MRVTSIISALAAFFTCIQAFSNPLSCSGTCTNTHDPSLIRRSSDGTYYRFATGSTIPVYSAPTIQGPWTYKGTVLPGAANVNNAGNTDLWAPDVRLVGSTYYCFYAASATFGEQNSVIGVATSTTLDPGSWTDHGAVVTSVNGDPYNAIDGNLLPVGDGFVLNFGSFWSDIYQVKLGATPTATASGAKPTQIAYNGTGTHPLEGSYMVQYESYYYLFFSSGICCNYETTLPAPGEEYKIEVCRSTSASGPFVDQAGKSCLNGGGTLVLGSHDNVYGPGGQGVYLDPSNSQWYIYYHYFDKTKGYSESENLLGVNKLVWGSNGWPTV